MAWWQKKLLRFALSRTGLLDEKALNLDGLDMTWGKKNVVELKDVGLNIARIGDLAKLPPSLRVETARILSLRLTVPADIYQSSIVVEVDGVELSLILDEHGLDVKGKRSQRTHTDTQSPQHRKTHRRMHSTRPHDPGGSFGTDEAHIPSAEELARSFILEEPPDERVELAASVAVETKGMEDSILSDTSDTDGYGTGVSIGLPGFLANFLHDTMNRLQVHVRNVEIRLQTTIPGENQDQIPITLRLCIGAFGLSSSAQSGSTAGQTTQSTSKRQVKVQEISLEVLSPSFTALERLSAAPSRMSPAESNISAKTNSPQKALSVKSPLMPSSPVASTPSRSGISDQEDSIHGAIPPSLATRASRISKANSIPWTETPQPDLEIQAGDDNVSWGSRRSQASAPPEDLWNSVASEDELPDSLLLDPSPMPRFHSSGSASPESTRSPYSATPAVHHHAKLYNDPELYAPSQGSASPKSFRSIPAVGQSQESLYHSHMSLASTNMDEEVFNDAEGISPASPDIIDTEPDITPPMVEDLEASREFDHEEARSLYMSAMTNASDPKPPGGWTSDSQSGPESSEDEPQDASLQVPQQDFQVPSDCYSIEEEESPAASLHASGNLTPRPGIRNASPSSQILPENPPPVSLQILQVDYISIWLPVQYGNENSSPSHDEPLPAQQGASSRTGVPGSFSAYSELAASRRGFLGESRYEYRDKQSPPMHKPDPAPTISIAISVGIVKVQLDFCSGLVLYRMVSFGSAVLSDNQTSSRKASQNEGDSTRGTKEQAFSISVQSVGITWKKPNARFQMPRGDDDNLVSIDCDRIQVKLSSSKTTIGLGRLEALIGKSPLLTFQREKIESSIVIMPDTPDVFISLINSKGSDDNQGNTHMDVRALPIHIVVDLLAIDDFFDSLGGLSTILEVGSSVLSDNGISKKSSPIDKPSKGVRFSEENQMETNDAELKVDIVLEAVQLSLRTELCMFEAHTSKIKAIYRARGMSGATVNELAVSGPHFAQGNMRPMALNLSSLRVEYASSPQDRDLERLLALLTPSKDKYDNDDDILVDTLLRQRKKGAVIRLTVATVLAEWDDWDWLDSVKLLSNDMSKLSAVARYLPEDERPGILTLIRVKETEIQLPINPVFGKLLISSGDFHCAHVGLPLLLTLSVGSLRAGQIDGAELLHAFLPSPASENLPMIMARMLGNEMEPTVKIKLFNICIEYSVPTILALTNFNQQTEGELIQSMVMSVAGLGIKREDSAESNALSSESSVLSKRLRIELLVHDSAIGLSPPQSNSKALFVMADARLSTLTPKDDDLAATFELKKAAIFLADEVADENNLVIPSRRMSINPATTPQLMTALCRRGFVSIGSILAAKINVQVRSQLADTLKSVDVVVASELLLLESCADSTHTLTGLLSELAPPSYPSKQPKYLTEPMTIDDMMASFTGEAFPQIDQPPEKLFDVDEDEAEDSDMMLELPAFGDDPDGLLADSEMSSSLYGPIGGDFDLDMANDNESTDEMTQTAESLLEDDPFEMPLSPLDAKMTDAALVRDLNKQAPPSVKDSPVHLGLYEIEDLGFEALGPSDNALGTKYRFNTPAGSGGRARRSTSQTKFPFHLRLRDVNLIWNIYDGYDWQRTRDGITDAVEKAEIKAEERKARHRQMVHEREDDESVIGDFLFNSIYIGVPSNADAQDIRRQINRGIDDLASETESMPISGMSRPTSHSASGHPSRPSERRRLRLERSRAHKVAFEIKGLLADVVAYPPDSKDLVNSIDVRIRDFEIFDNVPTSTWRKFLTSLDNSPDAREMSKPMIHAEILNVRTLEDYAASELALHVSILPLRLHVDQDALDFITRLFEFKDKEKESSEPRGEQPFLQRVEVDTVDLCLDYKPKKVDYVGLRSGHTTEFMNFVILDAANIRLKHAIVYGINGFEPLNKTLNDVWMPDIQRNQLPTILAGLAPVRSLVNIGTGMRDVVAIPIREYRKNGRVMRSIQKGAFHFGKTTTAELARFGAKVAMGTQTLLQGAEDMLASPEPSGPGRSTSSSPGWEHADDRQDEDHQRAISAYADQPIGVLSGLRSARRYLERDLLTARDALIAVQGEVLQSSGPKGAAVAVARHAPTIIIRPVTGISRAVGTALLGVGNQIDRSNVQRIANKYKKR